MEPALPPGRVSVSIDCNAFKQKSHMNPISRLLEPIANALEHGQARGVDVRMERLEGELAYSVTETGGVGMGAAQCKSAIRFGRHAAAAAAPTLANYSRNGARADDNIVRYERANPHVSDISHSKEAQPLPLLLGAPLRLPTDFEYIAASERVGEATSWTPRKGSEFRSEQQPQELQQLDQRDHAYEGGRLRYTRAVVRCSPPRSPPCSPPRSPPRSPPC